MQKTKDKRTKKTKAGSKFPAWIKPGAVADYHGVIGGPVTKAGVVVREPPFMSHAGQPVVFVEGVAGYVAVASLTPAGS